MLLALGVAFAVGALAFSRLDRAAQLDWPSPDPFAEPSDPSSPSDPSAWAPQASTTREQFGPFALERRDSGGVVRTLLSSPDGEELLDTREPVDARLAPGLSFEGAPVLLLHEAECDGRC